MGKEKKDALTEALEALNKKYGKGTVLTLGEKLSGDYDVISTGSLSFDYGVLGIGGFVKGKLYELRGWEGVGKSTICGHAVANCQAGGGKAVIIDGEHALDKTYFSALGVDVNGMYLSQPSCGEEGFSVAIDLIRTGQIDLVIIDSDSSLIPKSVILDGEVGQAAIGKKARLNSEVYPKLKNALVMNNTCVIVVSQFREKIGVMFGNPETTQGGHALKYAADCIIEVRKGTASKDGDEILGTTTKIKTIKNKMYPPFKKGEFEIVYGKGIDRTQEVLQFAVDMNVIQKSGSWYSYGEDRLGQGTETVKTLLRDNPEFYEEIEQKVIHKIKGIEESIPEEEVIPEESNETEIDETM